MKFKFTIQPYQTEAVSSVADVFAGQPFTGRRDSEHEPGNAEVRLSARQLLENIRKVQARNQIRPSGHLAEHLGVCSLDIEMETGTGKTYVYIKTMFELNRRYGWSKFIVAVPGIAIREGVRKSFETMQDHFMEQYGKKARFFVYDSKNLTDVSFYGLDGGISVMIINIQAFNSRKDIRRISTQMDAFGSRRPVDLIAANRPILILDEPQKMGGSATQERLRDFCPLFCLSYSATHKQHHNLVYVLDAMDAYNKRLVKRIAVKGLEIRNLHGTDRYLFLEEIVVSPKKPPSARLEFEVRRDGAVRRETRNVDAGGDLFALSHNMEQYRGMQISEIDALRGTVSFINGETIRPGEVLGDVSEIQLRRVQIRETIRSHLDKERELFGKGVKTLSLFFIDEVAKYRRYDEAGNEINSEYGDIFEQEYAEILRECLPPSGTPYGQYLRKIGAHQTHAGYFSVDRKGRKTDSPLRRGSDESDDISAYDLILKDKERLLSFENPVRFIFSHSALREGWDNPNVFQICTLKHGGSSAARKRQEVGRGLRLCVNQNGERMDADILGGQVHQVNQLTVIASDSYQDFAAGLQREIQENLTQRAAESDGLADMIRDSREAKISENPLNGNFYTEEFQALWNCIHHKYAYTVDFDSEELIRKAIACIDEKMSVTGPQYTVTTGGQAEPQENGIVFAAGSGRTFSLERPESSSVRYDLIGEIAEGVRITRRSAAEILAGIQPSVFAMFRSSPEEFTAKAIRLISEQKALLLAERISYRQLDSVYDSTVFTAEKNTRLSRACRAVKNVQDYVYMDGSAERKFVQELDAAAEVCVYAKLPKAFFIPTPVGNYSPDWAIAFRRRTGRPVFFIAGPMRADPVEYAKIKCAERLFRTIPSVVFRAVNHYQDVLDALEKQ